MLSHANTAASPGSSWGALTGTSWPRGGMLPSCALAWCQRATVTHQHLFFWFSFLRRYGILKGRGAEILLRHRQMVEQGGSRTVILGGWTPMMPFLAPGMLARGLTEASLAPTQLPAPGQMTLFSVPE
jgi:hypothetical protein